MEIKTIKLILFVLALFNLSCGTLKNDLTYTSAVQEAKSGNVGFAFMQLRDYLRQYPDSPHTCEIKFAIGEYYFQIKDYREAIGELSKYIMDYPHEKNTIFAKALLYKAILEYKNEPPTLEKLKELFFSKSIFLIFTDAKTRSYHSVLNNNYKILDYVDRIEVFKNSELFFEITP